MDTLCFGFMGQLVFITLSLVRTKDYKNAFSDMANGLKNKVLYVFYTTVSRMIKSKLCYNKRFPNKRIYMFCSQLYNSILNVNFNFSDIYENEV